MDLIVNHQGEARWGDHTLRCAIGRSGIAATKREGDGATPQGRFAMRCLFYRPDRLARPVTRLASRAINPEDGWCDAPEDPAYNRLVRLPHPASAEPLWREDRVYDLIVPLGYNDAPIEPGKGSAIFLHLAAADYGPTAGCIALACDDLLRVVREADRESCVMVA
jgi:L,D-peptidoglycan transpeptidase YkuD (ErfK/YbiS/YcfS/YnhG family)